MIKLTTIASDLRTNAMLCCSAAVLLTATASAAAAAPDAFDIQGYNGGAAANVSATQTDVAPASKTLSRRGARSAPAVIAPAPAPSVTTSVTPVTAYNYYVSPTGNDAAAGTKTAPFRTLARAVKAVRCRPDDAPLHATGLRRGNRSIFYLFDTPEKFSLKNVELRQFPSVKPYSTPRRRQL